jgi:3-phosphoshikimate 1-carboxyvinyltransferase
MRRIADPLRRMGATVLLRDGEYPPIAIQGGRILPTEHVLAVASAQIKSCILFAGMG